MWNKLMFCIKAVSRTDSEDLQGALLTNNMTLFLSKLVFMNDFKALLQDAYLYFLF